MEETTQPSTSQSKSILVVSPAPMLEKGGPGEELVLPSLPPPGQRRREREELVCGTVSRLAVRQMGSQKVPDQANPENSEGGREKEGSET